MHHYNSKLKQRLSLIANTAFQLEKLIKSTFEEFHDMNESHADYCDLCDLDYFREDLETFRIDEIAPRSADLNELNKKEFTEPYDANPPGRLSIDQMGLRVGRA
jgi:hypothetical protein